MIICNGLLGGVHAQNMGPIMINRSVIGFGSVLTKLQALVYDILPSRK